MTAIAIAGQSAYLPPTFGSHTPRARKRPAPQPPALPRLLSAALLLSSLASTNIATSRCSVAHCIADRKEFRRLASTNKFAPTSRGNGERRPIRRNHAPNDLNAIPQVFHPSEHLPRKNQQVSEYRHAPASSSHVSLRTYQRAEYSAILCLTLPRSPSAHLSADCEEIGRLASTDMHLRRRLTSACGPTSAQNP